MKHSKIISLTGLVIAGNIVQADNKIPNKQKLNVLFIIDDDLTTTALKCYGNNICVTPNINRFAQDGMKFTHAYCQYPVCGPSRASLMSGYYPSATKVFGYVSGRNAIGPNRDTWTQYFKKNGYYTARVSKIFHMNVPGAIESGSNGSDDPASWNERFNVKDLEWQAPGEAWLCQDNPKGTIKRRGGNVMTVVKTEGFDIDRADGMAAEKACELIRKHKEKPFFLAVGFVRPHVPFVAPKKYFDPFPLSKIQLPEKIKGDWSDIPKAGINYRTTIGMKMTIEQQKRAISGYYACVHYMDAQFGKVLKTLKDEGLEGKTVIIFTSDHGFHLDEHDFWMKVGLMEESSRVPLIIKVPGKKPGICNSFVELVDLFPTVVELCRLPVPKRLQGKSLVPLIDDPSKKVRNFAFSMNNFHRKKSYLIRNDKWAYIQHEEDASKGVQLYNMEKDPKQYTNLAKNPEYQTVVKEMRAKLAKKLAEVRKNDLNIN